MKLRIDMDRYKSSVLAAQHTLHVQMRRNESCCSDLAGSSLTGGLNFPSACNKNRTARPIASTTASDTLNRPGFGRGSV